MAEGTRHPPVYPGDPGSIVERRGADVWAPRMNRDMTKRFRGRSADRLQSPFAGHGPLSGRSRVRPIASVLSNALRFLTIAAALAVAAPEAHAAAGQWAATERVEARLVSAVEGVGELKSLPLGLELKLKPGWKTYWRSPGDAGLPPQLDWSQAANVAGATILYPAPHRMTLLGLQTYGYADHVVLPLAIDARTPGAPLDARVSATVLVCEKICVPETLELALALPAGPATPGAEAQLVNRFRASVPGDGAASGLSITGVAETSVAGRPALKVELASAAPFSKPDVFVESDPPIALDAPTVSVEPGRAVALLPLTEKLPPGTSLAGRKLTLTAVDGERSAERAIEVSPAAAGEAGPATSLLAMIGLALVGGLILNLMPCVLPVLSLKLFALAKFGGAAPREVRAGFLASAAGIVASFLAIAGALVALKAAGSVVGWGVQFQQPVFVAAMIAALTLFACNLFGLFEIPLPGFASSGADFAERRAGLAGHFATGVLATLLATPCSAPFLGTAVGFALAGGPTAIFLIFLALGLGVAAPYLAVALFPGAARFVPKPGRWMSALRAILGLALALTALWLLGVLSTLAGGRTAILVAGVMLAIVAALAMKRHLPSEISWFATPTVAILVLIGAGLPAFGPAPLARALDDRGAKAGASIAWQDFDRAKIRGLVAQGKTVLVDVTADWCVTCQANKRLVLDRADVAGRISSAGVVPMQADWTRPDAAIAAYLAEHGRYGIPFNAVYGPGAPTGVALPELLTPDAVLAALDKASDGDRSASR